MSDLDSAATPRASSKPRFDVLLARLQFWLQGVGHNRWPWCLARVGNAISDWRFWRWETSGGTHAVEWEVALAEIRELGENATTNVPPYWMDE